MVGLRLLLSGSDFGIKISEFKAWATKKPHGLVCEGSLSRWLVFVFVV